jgi:lipopolysaccharide/colanic/teichoic acid biosynthesis glycosyltransferase
MYRAVIKPLIDFIISFVGILALSPIFLILTVLLFISNRGKPFFTQLRPGKDEVIFRLIKFRTMNSKKDNLGKLLPDDKRITRIGSFVRSTSLDEIPQLLNVFMGQMSLVGPRPLLVKYLDRYSESQKKRHLVRPGITGWAQINGRNAISWDRKFELDTYYVENVSLSFDFEIIKDTFLKVINRNGISASGQVTMTEFMGNENKSNSR